MTLADLLGLDPDELSEKGKVNFESEATNFCNKVASFMRMTKSKKDMFRQKRDWFDYVIRFDQDQEKPEVSENISKSTEQRRKRKFVDANPSSVIQGSAALDYEDQNFTEAAQVLREIHKNPELGPKLLKLVKQIKKGKDDETIIPSLKISAIKYACNVLGNFIYYLPFASNDSNHLIVISCFHRSNCTNVNF